MKRSGWRVAEIAGRICAIFVLCVALPNAELQAQDNPFGVNWPQEEGRNLTDAWCGGCHSLNLVKQQGLTRGGWDVLLNWMSEKQKMPPLHGEQRSTVLDYLAANFGVDSKGAVSSRKVRRGRPPLVKSGSGYRLSATAGNSTSWVIGRHFPEIKGVIHIVNASPARADVVFTIGVSPV